MNEIVKNILDEYDEKKDELDKCKEELQKKLDNIMKNVQHHDISIRIKKRSSLENKIRNKDKYSSLKDITDIIGIRVITYFEEDIDIVDKIICREFEIDEKNSVDKRVSKSPESFGYSSLHRVVSLKNGESKNIKLEGMKFEIQIRTILQHAWAEIEHDLGYKNSKLVPKKYRRDFSRVSGLLELADLEFARIKKGLENYSDEVKEAIAKKEFNLLEINKITLAQYLETETYMDFITFLKNDNKLKVGDASPKMILSQYDNVVEQIIESNLNNIGQLNNLFEQHNDILKKIYCDLSLDNVYKYGVTKMYPLIHGINYNAAISMNVTQFKDYSDKYINHKSVKAYYKKINDCNNNR